MEFINNLMEILNIVITKTKQQPQPCTNILKNKMLQVTKLRTINHSRTSLKWVFLLMWLGDCRPNTKCMSLKTNMEMWVGFKITYQNN
jgi:hypothetical protein